MKAMILVLSSKECMNLLNGDLSVLARKKFSSDYVGWVYIYCMKARPYLVRGNGLVDNLIKEHDKNYIPEPKKFEIYNFEDDGYSAEFYDFFNGKVVARFWCDKVARITNYPSGYETYLSGTFPNIKVMKEEELLKLSCLTREELRNYLPCDKERTGYAIHITSLEIFDKPKEISEFKTRTLTRPRNINPCVLANGYFVRTLTCAPRSGWCYVEV